MQIPDGVIQLGDPYMLERSGCCWDSTISGFGLLPNKKRMLQNLHLSYSDDSHGCLSSSNWKGLGSVRWSYPRHESRKHWIANNQIRVTLRICFVPPSTWLAQLSVVKTYPEALRCMFQGLIPHSQTTQLVELRVLSSLCMESIPVWWICWSIMLWQ